MKIAICGSMKLSKKMVKSYFFIFLIAFVLNWIWEIFHSALYVHYKGGEISDFILFRAAVGDAIMILALVAFSRIFKEHSFKILILSGFLLAIGIEIFALNTGRWAYNDMMPITPLVKTGLTPTIQLALTGMISLALVFRK